MIDVASQRTRWAISSRTSVLAEARSGRSFAVGGSICVDVSNWTPSSSMREASSRTPSARGLS
jgi:riboflavin synthase alpha subunit